MRLLDLYVENFGRLSDFSLKFTDSLNTIEKENGYGIIYQENRFVAVGILPAVIKNETDDA